MNTIKNVTKISEATKEAGFMMTQYERFGSCDIEEYKQYYIDEILELSEENIYDYNEYLIENNYEPYYNDLDVMLEGFTPLQVAQKTFYGNFKYCAKWHKFNGYENIDSFDEYEIVEEMKKDKNFIDWYIEQNNLIDPNDDEVKDSINECNRLLKLGF